MHFRHIRHVISCYNDLSTGLCNMIKYMQQMRFVGLVRKATQQKRSHQGMHPGKCNNYKVLLVGLSIQQSKTCTVLLQPCSEPSSRLPLPRLRWNKSLDFSRQIFGTKTQETNRTSKCKLLLIVAVNNCSNCRFTVSQMPQLFLDTSQNFCLLPDISQPF